MPVMRLGSLASSSAGNSFYAQSAAGALLLDVGLSGKKLQANAEAAGADLSAVRAIILTHAHIDHYRSAGVLARRLQAPLFLSAGTLEKCGARLGKLPQVEVFQPGATLRLCGFDVELFATPHDAPGAVAAIIGRQGRRVGVLTDLGEPTASLREKIPTLDAAFLESNYDPAMLAAGTYPAKLKARIAAAGGHLSNAQAAALLCPASQSARLQVVFLAHLSAANNCPEVALACHRQARASSGGGYDLRVCPRETPSEFIQL